MPCSRSTTTPFAATTGWMPEGIHYDPASGRVLIDTEGHANMPRLVFVANAGQIP